MRAPPIRTAEDVDPATLGRFLRCRYSPEKAVFLEQHGDWWHRGARNRWIIEENGEVTAYCAVIPAALRVGGERIAAAWWADLVVGPEHRGEGLQRILDDMVRAAAPLIVGFPNALAAAIHRRHGWGVREDLEVRLLPLHPREIIKKQFSRSLAGAGLKLAAGLAAPLARSMRRRLERFEPRYSRLSSGPDAGDLAEIFAGEPEANVTTTSRDAEYLTWRYLDSPYRDELFVVTGGEENLPGVAAIVRVLSARGRKVARILDLFGALNKAEIVRDVLLLCARQAVALGACQVTALAANPVVARCLRGAGFWIRSRGRFCWHSGDARLRSLVARHPLHVVLGDSDNDEP